MSKIIREPVGPEAEKDIRELDSRIKAFRTGQIPEDKFKHFRLIRGVYGQRQTGVQMIRVKLPFGRVTPAQLTRIADVSDKYSDGKLHLTTRQDVQLYFVRLENVPSLWKELEEKGVTIREACGNTVRNVTASPKAGIDPDEPFDVSPYAYAFFRYFLRNPVCQDMGRKIKVAFSSGEKDTAFSWFHDIGFIPRIREENGKSSRGFKVVLGGGLGAQAVIAKTAYEFLEEDHIIPFAEAALRVFDRYGERARRYKARLKFLIEDIGMEAFLRLTEEEEKALKNRSYRINRDIFTTPLSRPGAGKQVVGAGLGKEYEEWRTTNVFEQKQKGYYGVQIRVPLGNLSSGVTRKIAALAAKFASEDIRITPNQGLLFRFVTEDAVLHIYAGLKELDLSGAGFDTILDVTACPGSDTCNLAVTNSTGLAKELEEVVKKEYYDLIFDSKILIKISGCMNSCGQHMAANIGFHGSSIKHNAQVVPAMQVVLGGGVDPGGRGFIAEKVIKIPTKKAPDALRFILDDYETHAAEGEYFNAYFRRAGKEYYYRLLRPLADTDRLQHPDYIDWGHAEAFVPEIGKGECAGIILDVVSTLFDEAEEKLALAYEGREDKAFADAIYNGYNSFVIGAKALLLSIDVQCNTQIGILRDFDKHFVETGKITLDANLESLALRINKNEPSGKFADKYLRDASGFLLTVREYRKAMQADTLLESDKIVVNNYYKA